MKLFFFKPKIFNPILIIVAKIASNYEYEKIEAMSNELFHILIENNDATESNILILSIIKDYNKTTSNLILPSTKSSKILTNRCYNDTKFLNRIIIQTLNNTDIEYYFEITDNKILMHMININLMALSDFYEIN